MVKAEAAILESDSGEQAERKLAGALERLVPDRAEARRIATSLGALIGLGGDAAPGGDTFASWQQFVRALANGRLLVLVFEDMHWADDGLLDFVDELVDGVTGVPLLVVATARPELLERRPRWAGGRANVLTVSLPPLSQGDTARLVGSLLERALLSPETRAALVTQAAGNPLYAEQFCRVLIERGKLEELPESVHGIIAARLDALTDAEKQVLQDAAVVGKVFWVGALEAVGGASSPSIGHVLQTLARREFVQRVPRSSVAGDVEFAFSHVLLRDVAYALIPRAARAQRHRLAAEWIDSLGRPEDHAELVAHHYLQALEYATVSGKETEALAERAVHALHRAGLRAIRLSANERAVEHLTRAVVLVERLPGADRSRIEMELQLQLGIALFAMRGFSAPEVERAYARATELMMASTPTADQLPVTFGLSIFHGVRGQFDRSTRLVERMTKLAADGDDSMKLQALHCRWQNSLFSGRLDDAVLSADEGRAIYRSDAHHQLSFRYGNHDPGVCASALGALALALRGDSVRALEQVREAVALSEALGHTATRPLPLAFFPWVHQVNGDLDGALLESQRALALQDEVVHPMFFGIARGVHGWAVACQAGGEEGILELESALAQELRMAANVFAAMIGALLAEAHLQHRRLEPARAVLAEMNSLVQAMGTYFYEPELLRMEAAWLRVAGDEADARRLLHRAIATAREHGSWSFAVRAAAELARTPSTQHEADLMVLDEACEHLAADNDTNYNREARTLLGRSS
jgi:hypothetical protein